MARPQERPVSFILVELSIPFGRLLEIHPGHVRLPTPSDLPHVEVTIELRFPRGYEDRSGNARRGFFEAAAVVLGRGTGLVLGNDPVVGVELPGVEACGDQ